MKEYFVIFILFTIFILYSVTLVSKDLNRMRCIEGFEAPALTFLQAIEGHACYEQHMHYDNTVTDTYQLQCYDQCSTDNTNVPVTEGRSNCMIPSDSNTSNCEVTVSTKCYLDGAFHEVSSNVNMYCPESGYADCEQCVMPSPRSDCSIVDDSNCQRTDLVTLPTGYARCTLDSNLDGLTYLEGDSNVRFACPEQACLSGLSGRGDSLTRITDGSCSSLECYGDAVYSDGRFDITGKVLGIKINNTNFKNFEFTLNNHVNIHSWANISIGITNDESKLNQSLTESTINEIYRNYTENGHPNVTIESMNSSSSSTEYIIRNGGRHGVYFNYIKNGNILYRTFETDGTTHNSSDHFVRRNNFKMTIDENDHLKIREGHNGDHINSNTLGDYWISNRTDYYFFIKVGPYHQNRFISNIRIY